MKSETPNGLNLAGPRIENDVRRLIDRYGAQAVKEAVKEQTKAKPGMPSKHSDWRRLEDTLVRDAIRWLEGGDPFNERSNNSIATRFVEQYPQRMTKPKSVRRRILRKLKEQRRYHTFVHAERLSKTNYPHDDYLRVLHELVEVGQLRDTWEKYLRWAEMEIADYSAKYGPPDAAMTMQDIQVEAAKPVSVKSTLEIRNVLQILKSSR